MKTLLYAALAAVLLATPAIAQDSLISLDSPMDATVISVQWVKPDASGAISGTVVVPGAKSSDLTGDVFLAAQQGNPIRVPVSPTGNFTIQGVSAGVYTLVYQAPQAFGAYALQVVAPSADVALGSTTVVTAAALDPQMALTTVAKYQPTEFGESAEIGGIRAAAGFDGGELSTSPVEISQVAQTASGGMRGKLIRAGSVANGLLPAAGLNVMLMQGGVLVDKTVTGDDGSFSFENLVPGNYELLASGSSGFAVVGFQLVEGVEVLTNAALANTATAAAMQGVPSSLVVTVATPDPGLIAQNPAAFDPAGEPTALPQPLGMEPFAPSGAGGSFAGGGGGGFGGGGGGGFGGGGIGGLAAIGAVLAASLASDDDDDGFTPAPSSPAIP